MKAGNIIEHDIQEGMTLDLVILFTNKILETKGYVKSVSGDLITLKLDLTDNKMTLPTGTDIYVLKDGLLLNITESKYFPDIKATKVSQRNHARVTGLLRFNYVPISQEHYDQNAENPHIIFEHTFGEIYKEPEVESVDLKTLFDFIYSIDSKINRVLFLLERECDQKLFSAPYKNINLSASGLRFTANSSFNVGNIIAFRILLPLTIETPINVLGQVMSSVKTDENGTYEISVRFVNLSQRNKDIITKYVFKRQRELLRDKSFDINPQEVHSPRQG